MVRLSSQDTHTKLIIVFMNGPGGAWQENQLSLQR